MVRATNWIGDVVMSLPALEALRARFPDAELVVVAKPWVGEIYKHHPAVNRYLIYDADGQHKGTSGFYKFVQTLAAEGFDAAILFQNAFQAALMAWLAHVPVRIGYSREGRRVLLTHPIEPPHPAGYGHQSYYYLQLLFRAGLINEPRPVCAMRLGLDDLEKRWAIQKLDSLGLHGPRFLVGLCPGASFGPAKRWLPDRFAELADRLIGALYADVVIFGSSVERQLAEAIAHEMTHTPTLVAGDTNLRQFLAILSQCRLVVTNDSGPMHLASALGIPTVAIFGSTDERATGPMGAHSRIVKHQVECSPCGLRECPIDFRCMERVTVDDVYQEVLRLVGDLKLSHERPA